MAEAYNKTQPAVLEKSDVLVLRVNDSEIANQVGLVVITTFDCDSCPRRIALLNRAKYLLKANDADPQPAKVPPSKAQKHSTKRRSGTLGLISR
jgi:hypothetical protein